VHIRPFVKSGLHFNLRATVPGTLAAARSGFRSKGEATGGEAEFNTEVMGVVNRARRDDLPFELLCAAAAGLALRRSDGNAEPGRAADQGSVARGNDPVGKRNSMCVSSATRRGALLRFTTPSSSGIPSNW
jgi:hypothetical protein